MATVTQIGFGIVVSWKDLAAKRGIKSLNTRLKGLRSSAAGMAAGMAQASGGLRNLAIAGAATAVVLKKTLDVASDFEQAMADVEAVVNRSSKNVRKDMVRMERQALALGTATRFTATEVGAGQQELARKGFDAAEVLTTIPGLIYAAGAEEGMTVKRAAEVIGGALNQFGLAKEEAGRVADLMAATSASSSTDINMIGESMKYLGTEAHGLQVTIEDTAMAIGVLGNAEVKASQGGTWLRNALNKLQKGSVKSKKILKELGIEIVDENDKFIGFEKLIERLDEGFKNYKGTMTEGGMLSEIFGIRGKGAIRAMMTQYQDNRKGWDKVKDAIVNAKGAAKEMSDIRLDTFQGSIILLKSALDGLYISSWKPSLEGMKTSIQWLTLKVNDFNIAWRVMAGQTLSEEQADRIWKISNGMYAFADGVRKSVVNVKKALKAIGKFIKGLAKKFGDLFGPRMTADIVGYVGTFTGMLPVISALAIGVKMLTFVFGGLANIIIGLGKTAFSALRLIGSAFSFVLTGPGLLFTGFIIALAGLFAVFKDDSESWGQYFVRLWHDAKNSVADFYENALAPIMKGWQKFKLIVGDAFDDLRRRWAEILVQTGWYTVETRRAGGTTLGWMETAVEYLGILVANLIDVVTWLTKVPLALVEIWENAIQLIQDYYFAKNIGDIVDEKRQVIKDENRKKRWHNLIIDAKVVGKNVGAIFMTIWQGIAAALTNLIAIPILAMLQIADIFGNYGEEIRNMERIIETASDKSMAGVQLVSAADTSADYNGKSVKGYLADTPMPEDLKSTTAYYKEHYKEDQKSRQAKRDAKAKKKFQDSVLVDSLMEDIAKSAAQRNHQRVLEDMTYEAGLGLKKILTKGTTIGTGLLDSLSDLLTAPTTTPAKKQDTIKVDNCLKSNLNIDGQTVAEAMSKHESEVTIRAGINLTPWQRRMMVQGSPSAASMSGNRRS